MTGVGQLAAADGAVDAVLEQVADAVAAAQVHVEPGVALAELADRRGQDVAGDGGERVHPQPPARRAVPAAQRLLGLLEVGQHLQAARVVRPPFVGQPQGARGAFEQAHAKRRFEVLQALRHAGLGRLQAIGGAGEAARVDDLHEGLDGGELVHGDCS